MRSSLCLVGVVLVVLGSGCKSTQRAADARRPVASTTQKVEAGCATCVFDMKDVTGCKLAAKIDGVAYLVTGSNIDDHGDAHAADGLCLIAKPAEVQGKIEGDRFVATMFQLRP